MDDVSNQPIGWVRFWTPTDDWYTLDLKERQVYFEGYNLVINRAIERGSRLLGSYKCRAQSPWTRFEFWEFPGLQVLIDMNNSLEKIGHFQYFEEDHTVGRRYERSNDANTWVI